MPNQKQEKIEKIFSAKRRKIKKKFIKKRKLIRADTTVELS